MVSQLSEWSDIIQRQGEERRREEEEFTQLMLDQLPHTLALIPEMTDKDLIHCWRSNYTGSLYDPRKRRAMRRLVRQRCYSEILRRMTNVPSQED